MHFRFIPERTSLGSDDSQDQDLLGRHALPRRCFASITEYIPVNSSFCCSDGLPITYLVLGVAYRTGVPKPPHALRLRRWNGASPAIKSKKGLLNDKFGTKSEAGDQIRGYPRTQETHMHVPPLYRWLGKYRINSGKLSVCGSKVLQSAMLTTYLPVRRVKLMSFRYGSCT